MNRSAAWCGAAALSVLIVSGPAGAVAPPADEDGVDVVNTETVQVYMTPAGEVESQRVYEALVLTGDGEVEVRNPVPGTGLRNLDGFSGLDVEDGVQVAEFDVNGVERTRTVSDFEGQLPIEIETEYMLDGQPVEPGDLLGADGELEVSFTVTNVTGEQRELVLANGRGGTTTTSERVPIPIVGSLTTTAPDSFTEVASEQANMAGDGRGGTTLSFTMTLFPPIGSESATFGYTATIDDGVVPRVKATVLPVDPLASPSFQTAATSYQGGSDTGTELAAGASQIDANLLKLRDGAGELLAGLLQLHAGSEELRAGLADDAAPGAGRLEDGAGELKEGLGKIDDGAGRLADGSGRLRDGTGDALSGSRKLHDGLGRISGGLEQLSASDGLPAAANGVDQLKAGVDQIRDGFGAVGTAGTLIDGLGRLESGLRELSGGLGQVASGVGQSKGGVDQVQGGLAAAVQPGGSLDQLIGGLGQLKALCGAACGPLPEALIDGAQKSKSQLQAANAGLLQVSGGLGQVLTGLDSQLIPGANEAARGAGTAKAGAEALKGGVQKVRTGLTRLDRGLAAAVDGVLRLSAGAQEAESGSGDLADGLGLIDAGAGDLADGAGQLADGTGDAADGSVRLADGAGKLADGLEKAADGSGRLTEGLGKAADGAPRLVDGAGRLSEEGTSVIVGKGVDTAQEFGTLYAVMEEGARRARAERMAFGAPEGATGLTAYSFDILGDDGESSRNWARGLGGLVLLGAGVGAFAVRRRLGGAG